MSRLRQLQQPEQLRGIVSPAALVKQYSVLAVCFSMFVAICLLAIAVSDQLRSIPDLAFLQHYHPVDAIEIYDKNDELICTVSHSDNRRSVDLQHVSHYMQDAVVAAEDRHFYEHGGVNVPSIVRALSANLMARRLVEGGSTITQQLVKNLFFPDAQRTLVRKTAEAIVAEQIDSRYSKQDILAMYLNEIYFGNGASGIEQAAQTYFGKPAQDLNLAESAFLAGIIKAPSTYGSTAHRTEALRRQNEVLNAMVECGYITNTQVKKSVRAGLAFRLTRDREETEPFDQYPYYVSYVLDAVHKKYDANFIHRCGLRVYTNLDPVAQETAEELLARSIKNAPRGIDEEALVCASVKDGAVRAIVGGAGDYWENQWNCAIAPHTVGSSFKPFVYLAAFLNHSLTAKDHILDAPLTVNQADMDYSPKNYDGKFLGRISVRDALAKSRNTCAVRVAQMVGIGHVAETARLSGLDMPEEHNLSIALGSCAESPLDMAAAYGTIARGGIAIKPWAIRHVDDLSGKVLEKNEAVACRVFPMAPVASLVDVMQDVVRRGTGTLARLSDRPCAGKTGTADKARDLWFVGFTPDMVTAVWAGNRQNKGIAAKHVTGGSVVASIWHDFNKQYYAEVPTPAGTLICTKQKDGEEKQLEQEISYNSSRRRRISYVPRQTASDSSRPIYNPANGIVTRNTKGITEYAWTQ